MKKVLITFCLSFLTVGILGCANTERAKRIKLFEDNDSTLIYLVIRCKMNNCSTEDICCYLDEIYKDNNLDKQKVLRLILNEKEDIFENLPIEEL